MSTADLYNDGTYQENNASWHAEDSAWKAQQILGIVEKNPIETATVVEIGCGAGQILLELAQQPVFADSQLRGFDISEQAIDLCGKIDHPRIEFVCDDFLKDDYEPVDLLLAIDVFEHVPDYYGFIEACRRKARRVIYHIPLDLHVSSVLRGSFAHDPADSVGHLHYFTVESALQTLRNAGHRIADHTLTNGAMGLYRQHPSLKRALANGPRWLVSRVSERWAARLLGGYSLLVLAE